MKKMHVGWISAADGTQLRGPLPMILFAIQAKGRVMLTKNLETDGNVSLSQCSVAGDGHGETEGLPAGTNPDCHQTKVCNS